MDQAGLYNRNGTLGRFAERRGGDTEMNEGGLDSLADRWRGTARVPTFQTCRKQRRGSTSSIRFWRTGPRPDSFRLVSRSSPPATDHHQTLHRGSCAGCPSSLARTPIPRSPQSARSSLRIVAPLPWPTAQLLRLSPLGSAWPDQHRPNTGPSCCQQGCTSDAGQRADEHP